MWSVYTHIMAYYSTIGMSEVMPFTTIRMDLEMIIGEGNGTIKYDLIFEQEKVN